jgi:hypothetical protein
MKAVFTNLEKAAKKMHLNINEEKINICQPREKAVQVNPHI